MKNPDLTKNDCLIYMHKGLEIMMNELIIELSMSYPPLREINYKHIEEIVTKVRINRLVAYLRSCPVFELLCSLQFIFSIYGVSQ